MFPQLYSLVITLHSLTRWLVVVGGVGAMALAFMGWFGKKPFGALDNRFGLVFTIAMDIQVALGFLLYFFISPTTYNAFQNFSAAMKDGGVRFFVIEHLVGMMIALALAHVGRVLSRKASDNKGKHKRAAILYGLSIVMTLLSIPWGRPLFRLG